MKIQERLPILILSSLAVAFSLAACSTFESQAPGIPSAATSPYKDANPEVKGPVLYVGSGTPMFSQYRLGSSEPLRTIKTSESINSFAEDSLGDLYVAQGGIDGGGVAVYDVRNLSLLRTGYAENSVSVAVDRNDYLYDAICSVVAIFPPNSDKQVRALRRGAPCSVTFDQSQNLYAASSGGIDIYAPSKKPGQVRYVRTLSSKVGSVKRLALDSSGDLFVAECVSCYYSSPPRRDYVEGYAVGSYGKLLTITRGINTPVALAVDSKGFLYVANLAGSSSGWTRGYISVYAPGSVRPQRRITDGVDHALALAIDPSDNLYVANEGGNSVTVYAPGGAKPTLTIKKGLRYPTSLFIH